MKKSSWLIAGVLGSSVAYAQYLNIPQFNFAALQKYLPYLANESLQYTFVIISLWIISYCVLSVGVAKIEVFGSANKLNKQGKILTATLAMWLPFAYIFAVRNLSPTNKIIAVMTPFVYWLGLALAFFSVIGVYKVLEYINVLGPPTPPAGSPPAGGTT